MKHPNNTPSADQSKILPIPEGFEFHHRCRNKGCVNPFHLEVVTVLSHRNYHRSEIPMAAANKAKTHCPRGHEYTAENTYFSQRLNSVMRHCRACRRIVAAKVAAQRKAERHASRK
jgi:HNH endonuclease